MPDLGRPSKLTPEIRDKVLQAIQLGCPRKQAAAFGGIDEATLRRWLARGRDPDEEPYAPFREAVLEAEAKATVALVGSITQAARGGDVRASIWLLERKLPELFSPRSRLHDPYRVLEILDDAGLISDHEEALAALARSGSGLPESRTSDEDLDDVDLTEEQRTALFDVLHATRVKARVVDPEAAAPVDGNGQAHHDDGRDPERGT